MSDPDAKKPALEAFLSQHRACLVVLSGPATGLEFALDQRAVRIGRGPGVDLAIDDPSLEIRHALLEFRQSGYWLRSLAQGSTTALNGGTVSQQALKQDDRIQLGDVAFEYSVEPRAPLAVRMRRSG